jgi:heme-degrading monooxygenase HmoA
VCELDGPIPTLKSSNTLYGIVQISYHFKAIYVTLTYQEATPKEALMIVVIFEVVIYEEKKDRYFDLAVQLHEQLAEIDGFISIERFESLATEGKFVSLSYWRDQIAVNQWYNKPAHAAAQSEGRGGIFKDYRIRVAEVFKNYDLSTGRPET